MAHHITEPTELFPHLQSSDLHVIQEVKALIQDHLYSGARDSSFQNALVDYYMRTNSQHALDILCKVREPLDKPLVDKLNDCMKAGTKLQLQSLTLLSHIVRRQPTWLHKIVQTSLYSSLLQCLKTSTDCPVVMCGLLTLTTLLPMIPSLIGPSLDDIFEVFARFAEWNLSRPGGVPEVYQIHIHAAVYALFHRLYGMFPWNFIEFLRGHYATRMEEFSLTVLPMLEHVRLHPQLILGSSKVETEATRWRKMEVHDILTECSRVSLDLTESAVGEDVSLYGTPAWSESGRTSSASIISQARRTSSPLDSARSNSEQRHKQGLQQRPHKAALEGTSAAPLDPAAMIWSPSVFCGLATPPSSRPDSPRGSLLDASFNSSLQLVSSTTTPRTTPRDSPAGTAANLTDDVKAAAGQTTGQISRSSSASKLRSKVPPPIRNLPLAHKTVSAPSTPGYTEKKALQRSPRRKGSGAGIVKCFDFDTVGRPPQGVGRHGRRQRSRESSGESTDGGGQRSSVGEGRRKVSMVSMKDLPNVIKGLAESRLNDSKEDDLEVYSELSDITQTSDCRLHGDADSRIPGVDQTRTSHQVGEPPSDDGGSLESRLPFKVDFDLSEIPCDVLKSELESRKEQLIAESLGEVDKGEVTLKLQEFCLGRGQKPDVPQLDLSSSEAADQKSLPIPVPSTSQQPPWPSCEVCSSAGKSVGVTQVTDDDTPLSNTLEGGFTPIRDPPVDPHRLQERLANVQPDTSAEISVVAEGVPYAHMFPYALTTSWPQKAPTSVESSMEFPTAGTAYMTPQGSRENSAMGAPMSSMAFFSPNELLDRHIQLGDTVHTKELSMLPLPSQTSVNWTHFGGAAPADEIDILKNQVIFLHNQVLYERHKREVHAERNRRLLGKTHKAKASQEQNVAMKEQIKLQEHKIEASQKTCELLRLERNRLQGELDKMGNHFNEKLRKLEKDREQLGECNSELQKLLVEHKREVDQSKKQLQTTRSELYSTQRELEVARVDLGTTKSLKDEVTWLNKELLLLGEVNQKLREKVSDDQLSVRESEEHTLLEKAMRKELSGLKETLSEKVVQLNAAKTRISELEAVISNKDVSISEQKRFLETMKSLSKGRIEAIESKYNAQKKVNQRLEASILSLKKTLHEQKGKAIFRPRVYTRTNSEQIVETLRQNEGDYYDDRRSSWHPQGLPTLGSTPVKGHVPPGSSVSPIPSGTASPASIGGSPATQDEEDTRLTPSKGEFVTHGTVGLGQNAKQEWKDQIERASPVSRIQFSPSSPFQRVRSSHSEPTGNGSTPSKGSGVRHQSKSWPHQEGMHHPTMTGREGGTPPLVVIDLSDSRRALVEDEASHVGDESLASILEMDLSGEARRREES